MNSNRSVRIIGSLAVVLLATGLSASLARAQAAEGQFTLPVETRWGLAVLPPGDYSFTLSSASMNGIIAVRGEKKAVMIVAQAYNQRTPSGHSSLTLVRHGAGGTVRSLELTDLGLTFYYAQPKSEMPILATAEPELIERVPVYRVREVSGLVGSGGFGWPADLRCVQRRTGWPLDPRNLGHDSVA